MLLIEKALRNSSVFTGILPDCCFIFLDFHSINSTLPEILQREIREHANVSKAGLSVPTPQIIPASLKFI